jgi:hypothetical protein
MKKALVTLAISALAVIISAGATLYFRFQPGSAGELGGLSTNDWLTNITLNVSFSTNVAIPITNWPVVASYPAAQFLTQGPAGSWWTSSIPSAASAGFYTIQPTNGNGTIGPFSYPGVWLPTLPGGFIKIGQ